MGTKTTNNGTLCEPDQGSCVLKESRCPDDTYSSPWSCKDSTKRCCSPIGSVNTNSNNPSR